MLLFNCYIVVLCVRLAMIACCVRFASVGICCFWYFGADFGLVVGFGLQLHRFVVCLLVVCFGWVGCGVFLLFAGGCLLSGGLTGLLLLAFW